MAAIGESHAYLTTFKKRPAASASTPTTTRRQERRDKNRIIKALAARMDRREEFEKDLVTMLKFANVEIRRLEERCSALEEEQNKLRAEAKKMKKAAKKRKDTKKQQSKTKKSEIKKLKTKELDIKAPKVETGVCIPSKDIETFGDNSNSRKQSRRSRLKAEYCLDPEILYSCDNSDELDDTNFPKKFRGDGDNPNDLDYTGGSDSSDDSDSSLDSHDSDVVGNW